MRKINKSATRYANIITDLLNDPDAPPVLRGLMEVVCNTLDTFTAKRLNADDYDFKFVHGINPATVRRELPAMLAKIWDWETAHTMPHELRAPERKKKTATRKEATKKRAAKKAGKACRRPTKRARRPGRPLPYRLAPSSRGAR